MSEAIGTAETLFAARADQGNSLVVGKGMDRFRAKEECTPFYGAGMRWSAMPPPKALARCLFVYPGVTSPGWASLKAGASNEATYMSHGMAYVSSALKARGHLAWLLDMRSCRSWPDFARRVAAEEYDLVFLGFLSHDAFTAAGVVRVLKEVHPSRPVIVGGLHPTVSEDRVWPPDDLADLWLRKDPPQQLRSFLEWKCESVYEPANFPKADCVIWNEAEIASCMVAEEVAAGRPIPATLVNAGTIPDLNETPHCDRELFDTEIECQTPLLEFLPRPFYTITFGRGCPFKCGFCNIAVQLSSSSVRLIKPDYFMDELEQLRARHGKIGSLMIHDDIILYPKWISLWCSEIRKRFGYTPFWLQMRADFICKFPDLMREMAESGMSWVSVGIESGNQRVLDFQVKQTTVEQNYEACRILKSVGVNVFANWMLGLPTETEAEMMDTAKMMKEIAKGGIRHSASVYCSYPGTSLDRYLKTNDLLLPGWYTTSHYPWQRAIKGIDYKRVYEIQGDVLRTAPNHAEIPKCWPKNLPTA